MDFSVLAAALVAALSSIAGTIIGAILTWKFTERTQIRQANALRRMEAYMQYFDAFINTPYDPKGLVNFYSVSNKTRIVASEAARSEIDKTFEIVRSCSVRDDWADALDRMNEMSVILSNDLYVVSRIRKR